MTLSLEQIQKLLDAHQCGVLVWPYHGIERLSARHAAAKLGFELIAAKQRIRALEEAVRKHKQAHAGPEYMACFDVNADLWGVVSDA